MSTTHHSEKNSHCVLLQSDFLSLHCGILLTKIECHQVHSDGGSGWGGVDWDGGGGGQLERERGRGGRRKRGGGGKEEWRGV